MIARGQVLAVDEVKRELKRKDDDVSAWARNKRGLFVPLAHDIQEATKEVLAACPRLMAQHGANRNSADPFVVGLALARDGTVVTQERRAAVSSARDPRRLHVCGCPVSDPARVRGRSAGGRSPSAAHEVACSLAGSQIGCQPAPVMRKPPPELRERLLTCCFAL